MTVDAALLAAIVAFLLPLRLISLAKSLWDNNLKAFDEKGDSLEKVVDKKGDPLEEDGHIMRAMGLDIQSLINEQENMKGFKQKKKCVPFMRT
ncbi:uncharacterized protein C2845_PM12G12590 [Panicum miliaceum]|uniref:Uncharacterized protein n=1 Tax=Panicum miliaceum TaxID=4540 RepID=A0A3L6QB16_PANMI|nr:uncharacterized protein C2845_PM12G12590 [Panicum miliaceum]